MKKYVLTDVFIARHIAGNIGLQFQFKPEGGGEPWTYQMPFNVGELAEVEADKIYQLFMAVRKGLSELQKKE